MSGQLCGVVDLQIEQSIGLTHQTAVTSRTMNWQNVAPNKRNTCVFIMPRCKTWSEGMAVHDHFIGTEFTRITAE